MPGQFEESKHARGGKGSEKGGQFVAKGAGGGGGAAAKETRGFFHPGRILKEDYGVEDASKAKLKLGYRTEGEAKKAQAEVLSNRQKFLAETGLTMDQFQAVSDYQRNSSVNHRLRWGKTNLEDDALVEALDEAFDNDLPLAETTQVYRGVKLGWDNEFDRLISGLKPGAMLFDEGYMSASRSPEAAVGFADEQGSFTPGAVFSIRVPAGTKVLDLGKASKSEKLTAEQEVLLPRAEKGASLRVRSIGKDTQGRRMIECDYVTLDVTKEGRGPTEEVHPVVASLREAASKRNAEIFREEAEV